MLVNEQMQVYIAKKIGIDDLEPFEEWAFVGLKPKITKKDPNLIDRWNVIHPTIPILTSTDVWDAIDRMIDIWKERFS